MSIYEDHLDYPAVGIFAGYGEYPVFDKKRRGWFFIREGVEHGAFESADEAMRALDQLGS